MSLLRTAARASVATRVIGSTHQRQQQRWAAQDAAAGPQQPAVVETPAGAAAPSPLDQLAQLGELRGAGVLTEAEFEAQKARILSA
jgi:hypothetical protein